MYLLHTGRRPVGVCGGDDVPVVLDYDVLRVDRPRREPCGKAGSSSGFFFVLGTSHAVLPDSM